MVSSQFRIAVVVTVLGLLCLYSGVRYVVSHRPPQSGIGSAAPRYAVTDVGSGMASGMNDGGLVVGMHIAGTYPGGFPYFHGFLWQQGVMTDIDTFGGLYSNADQVSDSGQILGTAAVPGTRTDGLPLEHLSLWQKGALSDLSTFHGYSIDGGAIDALGHVYLIGYSSQSKAYHLLLDTNGVMRDLGSLGQTKITVRAANRKGQVVGVIGAMSSKAKRAFLWNNGRLRDLGLPEEFDESEAVGINDKGQIIGSASSYRGMRPVVHPFLWQDGKFQDLGTLGGGFAFPRAINNAGQIVGASGIADNETNFHAFFWQQGRMQDITTLIPKNTNWLDMDAATSINNRGQIVGTGGVAGDQHAHTFLLTPLPLKEIGKS